MKRKRTFTLTMVFATIINQIVSIRKTTFSGTEQFYNDKESCWGECFRRNLLLSVTQALNWLTPDRIIRLIAISWILIPDSNFLILLCCLPRLRRCWSFLKKWYTRVKNGWCDFFRLFVNTSRSLFCLIARVLVEWSSMFVIWCWSRQPGRWWFTWIKCFGWDLQTSKY